MCCTVNVPYFDYVEKPKLKGGEFYVNVHETNYRRLEPPLRIAVSGYMGVGIFIHKAVEILGKQLIDY